jgi:hypothetical protein
MNDARMTVLAGRAPAKDREVATAAAAVVKRADARTTLFLNELEAKVMSLPDGEAMIRSANTQDAYLSGARIVADNAWTMIRDGSASHARSITAIEHDVDQFERDYSHKGAKPLADALRAGFKSGRQRMEALLVSRAGVTEAIKRGCVYLDTHRSEWTVSNGKVNFVSSGAKRAFRETLGR